MKKILIFNKGKILPISHLTLSQFVTTIEKVYLYNFKVKPFPSHLASQIDLGVCCVLL